MTSETNEDLAAVEVVEKIRVVGIGDGPALLDVAPCSTFSANLTSPRPRAEGVCEPVTTIGSDMRGFADPASGVLAAALGLELPRIACASLNL